MPTLREFALGRVRSILGGGLPDSGGVVPVAVAAQTDGLDPRVSVGGELTRSERDNKQQTQAGQIRVVVDGSEQFVETEGTLALTEIQADIEAGLTTHVRPWGGGDLERMDEVAWEPSVNRYVGVQEFAVRRTRLHPQYQP